MADGLICSTIFEQKNDLISGRLPDRPPAAIKPARSFTPSQATVGFQPPPLRSILFNPMWNNLNPSLGI
jgi:hypothetical protein